MTRGIRLFAWLSNNDSRSKYIAEHPEMAKHLVEHAFNTYDLEASCGNAMLVMGGGWKPPWHAAAVPSADRVAPEAAILKMQGSRLGLTKASHL